MKWLIIIGLLIFGVIAYRKFQSTSASEDQQKMHAWAGAFWGGLIGCFFGIAGFGGAIAGTIPGAVLGYFFIPLLLQKRQPIAASTISIYEAAPEQEIATQSFPDSYYDLVSHLRYSTMQGHIFSVTGRQAFAPDEKIERANEEAERKMDADLVWWYEGEPRQWYVYLRNHSPLPIVFLCFDITPGLTGAPTGPTNRVYIKLLGQIPAGFPFVVIFPTPKGSVDHLDAQDCSLHSAYQTAP